MASPSSARLRVARVGRGAAAAPGFARRGRRVEASLEQFKFCVAGPGIGGKLRLTIRCSCAARCEPLSARALCGARLTDPTRDPRAIAQRERDRPRPSTPSARSKQHADRGSAPARRARRHELQPSHPGAARVERARARAPARADEPRASFSGTCARARAPGARH